MQCGRGTGSSKRSCLWDLRITVSNRSTRSLQNSDNEAAGTHLVAGTEHNIPFHKVYKQIVSNACFHFLTVVIGLDFARRNQLLIASVARCRWPSNRNTMRRRWSFKVRKRCEHIGILPCSRSLSYSIEHPFP
jgi:hypothetical protein